MFVSKALLLDHAAMFVAQVDVVRETTLAFSGPQFFTALVAGLLLTFGFQMLLTNFSVAAGISVLSLSPHHEDSSSSGSTMRPIGKALGLWTLATVTIALFVACLLAVKLTLLSSTVMGATVGLSIWAAYFSILIWISSTTVGSLVGSVVNTATRGFQAVFGTATAALGMKAAGSELVASAEAATAAVRREMTAYIDPQDVRDSFRDVIGKVKSPELDIQSIRSEFEKILKDSELTKNIDKDNLPTLSRETFENLLKERTDLSPRDVKKIVDELDRSWHGTVGGLSAGGGLGELLRMVKSAKPQDLLSGNFSQQLERFVKDLGQGQGKDSSQLQQALGAVMAMVLGRLDLSDLDVEKIKGQLKTAQSQIQTQAEKVTQKASPSLSPAASVIRSDVEYYLLHTYSWQMTPARIEQDFRQTLYDPKADARAIRQAIEDLDPAEFTAILKSRGVFTQQKISELTATLSRVRQQVLDEVRAAESAEMLQVMQNNVSAYLRSTPKSHLFSPGAAQDLSALLTDNQADPHELHTRLTQLKQYRFASIIEQRADLSEDEKIQLSQGIEMLLQTAIADTEGLQKGIQSRVETQWQKVQDYLRNTGKDELNPDGIKRDLQTLLSDPQAGVHDLKMRAGSFDRDTLVQLLSQRQNLSEDQVNGILNQVESSWKQATHAPAELAHKAKEQYDDTTHAIADYLWRTGKEELNPDGIKRDLTTLLQDPKMGAQSIRDRLSHVDRDTLVALLSQRNDLSEAEVNRVQDTLRQALRTPQRLAVRAQTKAHDFQTALEDYLRNTDKNELNPDGIKRDLGLLFQDPRLGLEHLGDRLSHVDRNTIVALLSGRDDISQAEAEQIVDRVLAVRDRVANQLEMVKAKVQSAIDSVLAKIRNYLNSLERPELNYEGIQQDVRTLFDDPNAGFEALRDRLSHFDRDTLVAVLSSRDDISPADANRIIDRVESVRTNVLHRAERIQAQIQSRLADLKYQAQAQAEATRKAAATAAWWLFATAFTSGIAAAIAGAIAVAPVV